MSNKIYEGGYFNEYQKMRYANSLPETSSLQARRILSRAKSIEETYGQDLYNFTLDQIENLLHYLNPSTLNASRSNFYMVQNYIRWGIEQDLRDTNINPLDVLAENNYFKKFIDTSKKALYTKDEIDSMISVCVNAQDAFPIIAIFEGVFGKSGYDELLNLKRQSIVSENLISLTDGEHERVINVSPDFMNLMYKALDQKTYIKKNGILKPTMRSSAEANLEQSDYVLRNVITRSQTNGKADKFLIQRRIAAVKSYNDDWVKVLSPYIIRNSGMLYMAKNFYDKHGEIKKHHYEEISEKFGISKVMNNGYEVYNYHRLKEDFLNVETIIKVYEQ